MDNLQSVHDSEQAFCLFFYLLTVQHYYRQSAVLPLDKLCTRRFTKTQKDDGRIKKRRNALPMDRDYSKEERDINESA